jgi:hypothetical protein
LKRRRCNLPQAAPFHQAILHIDAIETSFDIAVRPKCAWHFAWRKLWRNELSLFAALAPPSIDAALGADLPSQQIR